jgi:multiple sugar transport system ATP-binding protein
MTTITLAHVSKQFEQADTAGLSVVQAVHDISLKIQPGELLAILGPSGCGKSTLLRLIGGLLDPDSGKVLYDNVDLANIPPLERNIGMVFQEPGLMPIWKTRRSVGFFLELRDRSDELSERMEQISSITGLGMEKLLTRRPGQLSGGEIQRVTIARALARDLRVLLLDEPFSNLDAKLRSEARLELQKLLQEFPVTTVYVTHDQVEAMALAKRIALMREGELEQLGTYQQLRSTPANLFVARFIGQLPINLFKGRVDDGHWQGENFGGFPIRRDLPNGTEVILGVQAENISLVDGGTPGVVDQITPYYAERFKLITLKLGKERWSLTVPFDQDVEWGETLYCQIDPNNVLYFDAHTEVRIG